MESDYHNSNKRIAKNSLIVYFRLFVTTIIGLFTSRFVLKALGPSDYGLYGVVGGVIAFFAVISGAMSSTTIRFLNYEIGKPDGDSNKVFNICHVIHIAFAILIFILGETIGIFYINNYLNVAPGKESDAMFVFQVSLIVSCIGVINVPFQSVFIAMEKFLHIAVIDIVNTLLKFGLIILLLFYKGNALRLYAIIMSTTTLLSFIIYHYLGFKYWSDIVRWKVDKRLSDYKELIVYNNYNFLASLALLCRSQGSNMLINFFFGTIVNGAYGIARTVQSFVEVFTVNFDSASAPQITQNVSGGDMARASYLASKVCRMCQLLSLLIVFPLFVEMELLLHIWLGEVPEYTVQFCRVILITVLIASTGGGLLRLKDALGKIKWFMITYSFWFFITLPVGYLLFKLGYPPVTILILYIITDVVCRFSQLVLMKIIYRYDVISFCKESYTRPLLIAFLMAGYVLLYNQFTINSFLGHFIGLVITVLIGMAVVLFIGMPHSERKEVYRFIQGYIVPVKQ